MSFKKKALTGVFWSSLEGFGVKGIGFLSQIILARILLPSDFGLIAMIAVFIGIGDLIADSGLGQSLIRNKNSLASDFSSVFYLNILLGLLVYLSIYFIAPFVAIFYEKQQLTLILRVMALAIPFGSFSIIQKVKLTIKLNFKKIMLIQLVAVGVSSFLGVVLAYIDYGVWAIVFLKITYPFLSSLLYWIDNKWKPSLVFDIKKIKYHYNFGVKIMLTYIINSLFNDIYSVIIGKFYALDTLGFYNRARTFQNFPVVLVGSSLNKITYPLFSQVRDNKQQLKSIVRKINKLFIFLFIPFGFFLIFNAETMIGLVLGDKWLSITPFFKILLFGSLFYPVAYYNTSIINAFGDPGLILNFTIISRIFSVIGLFFIASFGVYPILVFQSFNLFLMSILYVYFGGLKIEYKFFKQVKDVLPELGLVTLLVIIIHTINGLFGMEGITYSISFIILYAMLFIAISELLKIKTYLYIKNTVMKLFK